MASPETVPDSPILFHLNVASEAIPFMGVRSHSFALARLIHAVSAITMESMAALL